ncbi:sensor histidine kinase [Microbispora sp. H10670]|uniref:sensor histidine kinase n=1 Tax=Microbispora sp. H10670 TaxID=2729108 RepID=UPI002872B8D3|nr:histidine kinase [Microbispora sp. H10670]
MRSRSDLYHRVDPVLPVVVGIAQVFLTVAAQYWQLRNPDLGRVPLTWWGCLLLLVGPGAIALRRRAPVVALVVTLTATSVYMLFGYAYGPVFLSPIIVIVSAVGNGHRRAAWSASGAFFLFVVAYATWFIPHRAGLFHHTAVAAYLLLTLTVAEWHRVRRERLAERRRVAREEARRQASEERLTMAQELHDVLAHNISLIHVQASTALHLLDDHPEQARTALTAIKQASRDVLTEMRGVLSLLKDGAPRSPTAGMAHLDGLAAGSGLPVTVEVAGEPRPLPPGIDRAGYRIVQESLTNVSRHAPGSRVTINVAYAAEELRLVIEDDGAGTARAVAGLGGGNGIPGMRERAAALGGSLSAGPRPGGGFRVAARLPLPPAPTPPTPLLSVPPYTEPEEPK